MTQTKKMKTLKNWCILCALMLGIAACSKEAQDAPQVLEPTGIKEGESIQVGSRDSIFVNFSIGANTEQLRLAQALDAEGVPASPFMEEKDVVIRFAVRKSYRVTYTDAVCKKVPGENKVTYKGIIRLPDLYAHIPPGSPRPPIDFNGHEIAGILLGEANGGTQFVEVVDNNTLKSIEQTELLSSESNVVRSKIPYVLDWTAFPLKAHGIQAGKQTLHFKPVGNLLRIQFHNQLNEAKTLSSITINSNAFVSQVRFSLLSDRLTDNILPDKNTNRGLVYFQPIVSSGAAIQPVTKFTKTYTFDSPIRVGANSKSKVYYLWVMPLKYTDKPDDPVILNSWEFSSRNGLNRILTQITAHGTDGKNYPIHNLCSTTLEGTNSLTLQFKPGSTIETAFKGGKLPLWYVAEYNVAPGGTSLMDTHYMNISFNSDYPFYLQSNHGLFNYAERLLINVPGYYLPRFGDFSVVLGGPQPQTNGINISDDITGLQEHREIVRFPGEESFIETLATYLTKDGIIYGLRFINLCEGNVKLTAYRYRRLYNNYGQGEYNPNARIEVTSMFLGSSFSGDINTISTPSFWGSANTNNSVTRIFPTTGIARFYGGEAPGESVTYYGEVIDDKHEALRIQQSMLFNITGEEDSGLSLTLSPPITVDKNQKIRQAVRLMKNEFKTAQ